MEEKLEQNEILIGKNLEILDVAKTIAKEKGISAEEVLEAMEVAKKEGKGAVSLDGRLIDIASIRQAEVLVQKAKMIEGK